MSHARYALSVLFFRNLDSIVQNLAKNFAEGTDYFKILVDIFAGELRSDKNSHLKNFHIIVPPLVREFFRGGGRRGSLSLILTASLDVETLNHPVMVRLVFLFHRPLIMWST